MHSSRSRFAARIDAGIKRQMKLPGDADTYYLRLYAVVCWFISLPFHYVFWMSAYDYGRSGGAMSTTSVAIALAMGVAAFGLGYFGLALYRYPASGLKLFLPSSFLYVSSALLAANAIYQLSLPGNLLTALESSTVSVAAFFLARRRDRHEK